MEIARIFWEKATAAHLSTDINRWWPTAFCLRKQNPPTGWMKKCKAIEEYKSQYFGRKDTNIHEKTHM
jgi:hypothetical protein